MKDSSAIVVVFMFGVVMGVLIVFALIDDKEMFQIPFTSKVFVRQAND